LQLLFPTADSARPFSMLGLGDIVIPGRMTLKLSSPSQVLELPFKETCSLFYLLTSMPE